MNIKHRCENWKDIEIVPGVLFGTNLEYITQEIKSKDKIMKDFWILDDYESNTFSIYTEKYCPFCNVELTTLLK